MKYYIKDGQVKREDLIVITKDGFKIYRPTAEMILADGWTEYTFPEPEPGQPTQQELLMELQMAQFNARTDISDKDALHFALIVYPWEKYLNDKLNQGQVVSYGENIWRVRQDISVVLTGQEPGLTTAALYGVIDLEHEGTSDDPIPYTPPMEIFSGKYYTQNKVKYKCIRDSGQELTHDLSALVGTYVEVAQ